MSRHRPVETLARDSLAALARAHKVHSRPPTELHQARVASRRLRELVPLLQLDAPSARKLKRQLRKVTRALGATRELDVLHGIIAGLHGNRRYPAEALERVAIGVDHERAQSRRELKAALRPSKMKRLAARVEAALDRRSATQHAAAGHRHARATQRAERWAMEARVVRRATQAGAALTAAGLVYVPGRLHDARIAVKRLRYVTEMLATAEHAVALRSVDRLKAAQDVLGQLHDLEVLIERARREQLALTPPGLTVWRALTGLVQALENDCRRLHGVFTQQRTALVAAVTDLKATPSAADHPRSFATRA